MKGKCTFISVTERISAKGNKFYDCWITIEGYSFPYRVSVWEQDGIIPVKGNSAELIIDQDRYCQPVIRIRL